jgi:archaellum component FlaF (FlaF/FlaG flagellin family)
MGYYSGVTSAKDEANKLNINIIRENFIIADANFNLSLPQSVNVTIYNYGPTNLEMSSIYLNGTQLTAFIASPGMISPGGTGTVTANFTGPGRIQTGEPQLIRAVSMLGNYYENYYLP